MKLLLLVKKYTFLKTIVFYSLFFSDKAWSEYIEYILDTTDYIQLHQEDLREFHQLSNELISSLNERDIRFERLNDTELQTFNNDLEKYYEQVELLNQKGELLLQSSATNLNDDKENQIEHLLETINRNYDSLTIRNKVRIDSVNNIPHSPKLPTPPPTATTEEEVRREKNE